MNARPRLQIAFLTGRSDPASCLLSPVQARFLAGLAAPGRALVGRNFPYDERTGPHCTVPLWRAGWRNLREHLRASRSSFAAAHTASVERQLEAAEHTVLLAGSCGLRLLLGLRLGPERWQRVSVFAFGNVQRRRPPCCCQIVVGRADRLARWCGGRSDLQVPGGHHDYLEQPEVAAACAEFVAAVEREPIAAGSRA
ncbi:MAG: hypothetical protein MUC36_01785 [Planctomycetes bacterium]|jgi:hypothetical protein|nr:hypothetical protein [Planctomycetota bacterium]